MNQESTLSKIEATRLLSQQKPLAPEQEEQLYAYGVHIQQNGGNPQEVEKQLRRVRKKLGGVEISQEGTTLEAARLQEQKNKEKQEQRERMRDVSYLTYAGMSHLSGIIERIEDWLRDSIKNPTRERMESIRTRISEILKRMDERVNEVLLKHHGISLDMGQRDDEFQEVRVLSFPRGVTFENIVSCGIPESGGEATITEQGIEYRAPVGYCRKDYFEICVRSHGDVEQKPFFVKNSK